MGRRLNNMTLIPIFDKNGIMINEISINDSFEFINGRVYKGNKHYYKGIGINYNFHYMLYNNIIKEDYKILNKSDVFYMGYRVEKKCFKNKHGIFQEQYQPQFSDFIGSCGVKELSIIENEYFKYSSVKLIESVCIDNINKQYYFIIDYSCKRKRFSSSSDLKKLKELLDYMIIENWNFIWDKNTIQDITENCLVSDIADIFISTDIKHKIGSVYSLLYSLSKYNINTYIEFIKLYNLKYNSMLDIVFNAIDILKQNNVKEVDNLYESHNNINNYKNIVMNYLIVGKNCADCNFVDFGNLVKNEYIRKTSKELNIN